MDEERITAILNGVKDLKKDASLEEKKIQGAHRDHYEGDLAHFSYSNTGGNDQRESANDQTGMRTLRNAREPGNISFENLAVGNQVRVPIKNNNSQQSSVGKLSSSDEPSSSNSKIKASIGSRKTIGVNSLIVSPRQKGNPLLQYIRNVPWEYGEVNADYVTGATSCVLFLSLKYHRLHPEYIYTRIKKLGRDFELRIILVVIDVENHVESMRELSKTCMYNDVTILACWSSQEAANYLSQLKSMETASPALIQGTTKEDYNSQLIEVMGKVRGVNKNDAVSLVTNFGSIKNAILDGGDNIEMIPGWGQTKAQRFKAAVNEPFVFNKEYDITEQTYEK